MVSTAGEVGVRSGGGGKVIALISAGHFLSHFYLLLIPPLFPLLKEAFGVGFTELGLAITVFSVVTALTQAPVGFLVDRVGARTVLLWGLFLEAGAFVAIGLMPGYWVLLVMMGMAGLANSVYHPADYAILNASVPAVRMGRAFSIHTASGMLGNAVAPAAMVALVSVWDWPRALVVCGLLGALVAVLVATNAGALKEAAGGGRGQPVGVAAGVRLLTSAPILLGVLFFIGLAIAGTGVSAFGVSTLTLGYGISMADAATVLSAYLFASPVGVLCGGWVADRVTRHHWFAAGCFVLIAVLFTVVAWVTPPLSWTAVLFLAAGFLSGAVAPSRDMLIRSVAPPGEMGKVFGFVSTGFNIGGMIAPPMFGYLLDRHDPRIVLWVIAGVSLLSVLTVSSTGRRRGRAPAGAPS